MAEIKIRMDVDVTSFGEKMADFRRKMEESNRAISISVKPTKDRTEEEKEFYSEWKFRVMLRRERTAALSFLDREVYRVRKELGFDVA